MTAEIAILNKSAVALAADSKVTLSIGGRQKTYDTVDKLFSLSKIEPMGAMIYGNAEFMGFPWGTVLKEYRRRKPHKTSGTVFEWADDLLSFLTHFFSFTDEDEDNVALQIAGSAVQTILQRWSDFMDSGIAPDDVGSALMEEIKIHIDELDQSETFLSSGEWQSLSPRIKPKFDELVPDGFVEAYPKIKKPLHRLMELSVTKAKPSPAYSGLVVAGFGEDELLPSLISFEIDGIIDSKLKYTKSVEFDTTRTRAGMIRPFAQSDMVYRFMEGIDPDYAVQLHQSIGKLLIQNSIDTAEALGHDADKIEAIIPALSNAVQSAVERFWQDGQAARREQFAEPIIDMAMRLPKDELAHMAESLVSLTSLQRRVSREIETVGGAIDVAVISKGDGFVWIKRKHYFNADRNLRFVNGYFSEFGRMNKSDGGHNGDS